MREALLGEEEARAKAGMVGEPGGPGGVGGRGGARENVLCAWYEKCSSDELSLLLPLAAAAAAAAEVAEPDPAVAVAVVACRRRRGTGGRQLEPSEAIAGSVVSLCSSFSPCSITQLPLSLRVVFVFAGRPYRISFYLSLKMLCANFW